MIFIFHIKFYLPYFETKSKIIDWCLLSQLRTTRRAASSLPHERSLVSKVQLWGLFLQNCEKKTSTIIKNSLNFLSCRRLSSCNIIINDMRIIIVNEFRLCFFPDFVLFCLIFELNISKKNQIYIKFLINLYILNFFNLYINN